MSNQHHIEAEWQEFLHTNFRPIYDAMPLSMKVISKRLYFAGASGMLHTIVCEGEASDGNVANLMTQTGAELKQFGSTISDFRL